MPSTLVSDKSRRIGKNVIQVFWALIMGILSSGLQCEDPEKPSPSEP